MKTALVVTTIQAPNAVMRELAQASARAGASFVVMGDRKSPAEFSLEGAEYLSADDQLRRWPELARALPFNHYVRKNLGYLIALEQGCDWLVETDDDNFPLANFFAIERRSVCARLLRAGSGWANVYRHFSPTQTLWPRGFPLELLGDQGATETIGESVELAPAVIQGLADDNPDVDAIYRLTRTLPVTFSAQAAPVALEAGTWCPFNSQNTWFRRDMAVLMYLPSFCSFRMTDIWRSFVAQRCLWAAGHRLVYVAPSVRQERNEHNLLRDFADEVPGYLNNARIAKVLTDCALRGDPAEDLVRCYEALVRAQILPADELRLVAMWVDEVAHSG